MRTDRLIEIVTFLLKKQKLTAPQVAARFEVSRCIISRDIETLCRAGIPVVTTQGCGGGIPMDARDVQMSCSPFMESAA